MGSDCAVSVGARAIVAGYPAHNLYDLSMPVLEVFGAEALRDTVITFRDTMKRHAAGINLLNVYPVPDGDTGTNMSRTLDAVVTELEGADHALESTCEAISHGSLMGARGNSGVILSQILRGLVTTLRTATPGSATKVAAALKAASVASYEAVLKPIEGTILTVVRETADAAQRAASDGATLAALSAAATFVALPGVAVRNVVARPRKI